MKLSLIHIFTSKLTRSISEKYQENPAYYDSFSKRIKDALEQYKEKVISEAEYLSLIHI